MPRSRCGRTAASIAATRRPAARRRHARDLHRRARADSSIAATGCRPSWRATSSSPSPPAISSAASSSATTARVCAGGRRTPTPNSSRRPTSGSGRSTCPPRPDGTIYVVDMYHGIIQQKGFITEYLRDHIVAHKLEAPINMGRIWRIVHDTTRRDGPPALAVRIAGATGRAAQPPERLVARHRAAAAGRSAATRASSRR